MRLIDADKLIQAIHSDWDDVLVWDESGETTADEFERLVFEQPTIDAEPVRHGHWQQLWEDKDQIQARCSCCGMVFWIGKGRDGNYCPNCGAKMDEVEE